MFQIYDQIIKIIDDKFKLIINDIEQNFNTDIQKNIKNLRTELYYFCNLNFNSINVKEFNEMIHLKKY